MKYTNLAAALHILAERQLTFSHPDDWDDQNDAHFMRRYREATKTTSVLATCFTQTADSYHHWRIFAGGSDGIRLEFDKEKLIAGLNTADVTFGEVRYLQIKGLRNGDYETADLPFIKRHPYADEKEYRIFCHRDEQVQTAPLPIKLSWIKRVTISPWMAPELRSTVKASIQAIRGCGRLRVYQSTLINNRDWQKLADNIAKRK